MTNDNYSLWTGIFWNPDIHIVRLGHVTFTLRSRYAHVTATWRSRYDQVTFTLRSGYVNKFWSHFSHVTFTLRSRTISWCKGNDKLLESNWAIVCFSFKALCSLSGARRAVLQSMGRALYTQVKLSYNRGQKNLSYISIIQVYLLL